MPDVLIVNGSAATVQTVPAGAIRRVTGLTDVQISTVAQTARCAVLPVTTKQGVRNLIAEMLSDVRVGSPYGAPAAADKALNRMK